MRKILAVLVSSITLVTVTAPARAGDGGAIAAGIIGGLALGGLAAAAAAPAYGYPAYGYRTYRPRYYRAASHCWNERRRSFDIMGTCISVVFASAIDAKINANSYLKL